MDSAYKLLAVIPAMVLAWLAWRRFGPERGKLRADTEISFATLSRTLSGEVIELRALVDAFDKREIACRNRIASLESQVATLTAARLRDQMGSRLDNFEELKFIFDKCVEGFALTSDAAPGAFLWVSQPICDALQYTCDEIVAMGWQKLIAPEDRERTMTVEGTARYRRVTGLVNEYVRKDGTRVQFRWYSTAYDRDRGLSISVVIIRDLPK
jgi:PAS domain S-box-containing protein